jgi:hypothetical protein
MQAGIVKTPLTFRQLALVVDPLCVVSISLSLRVELAGNEVAA